MGDYSLQYAAPPCDYFGVSLAEEVANAEVAEEEEAEPVVEGEVISTDWTRS